MKDKKVLGGVALLLVAAFWFYIKPNYLDAKEPVVFTQEQIAAAPRPTLVIAKNAGGGGGHGESGPHEGLVLNLKAPPTAPSYASVVIVLEFADPERTYVGLSAADVAAKNAEFAHELEPEMYKILDSVTLLFASKTPAEVATSEGKQHLKDELIEAVNEHLHHEEVEAVYFESFVTQ